MADDILTEIDEHATATGLSPRTICVRALGNSRFYEREMRRNELRDEAAKKLRAYMADNPPPENEKGAA